MGRVKKKGFSEEIQNRTPRDKLEIIVDTCAAGKKTFEALGRLFEFAATNGGYTKLKLVVPLQIGTELKQKLFSDFLEKTLTDEGDGAFHGFYKKHKNIVKIVDTPDSDAYKYFFAQKAFKLIKNDPSFAKKICEDAVKLSEKYFPQKLHKFDEKFFIRKLDDFKNDFKKNHKKFNHDLEKTYRKIVDYHDPDDGAQYLELGLKEAKEKRLGRAGHEFFDKVPDSYRILLQAMYSNNSIYTSIGKDKEFAKLRHDRGERAIEKYLYTKRSESDPSIVSVVISDDQGARASIQRLRQNTKNTVFVLSVYGFTSAMVKLGIYDKVEDGMSRTAIAEYEKRAKEYEELVRKDERTRHNYRNPKNEEKWEDRFVEVMKFGRWFELGEERHISK